jgi:hypothetical protein
MPRYGFGNPKLYGIMESVVCVLKQNGPVWQGAECFNYYFLQELDAAFFIVSDTLPGHIGSMLMYRSFKVSSYKGLMKALHSR